MPSAAPGVYTNVDTGETTTLGKDATPAPGIYVSEDSKTVIVVTKDDDTGKPVVMTAPAGNSGVAVGTKATVKKAAACK